MFVCARIRVFICAYTCRRPFFTQDLCSQASSSWQKGQVRLNPLSNSTLPLFSFLPLPSWLYNWEGQLSRVLQKRNKKKQEKNEAVRIMWMIETRGVKRGQMKNSKKETQQEGDDERRGVKVEVWRGTSEKWEEGRDGNCRGNVDLLWTKTEFPPLSAEESGD